MYRKRYTARSEAKGRARSKEASEATKDETLLYRKGGKTDRNQTPRREFLVLFMSVHVIVSSLSSSSASKQSSVLSRSSTSD